VLAATTLQKVLETDHALALGVIHGLNRRIRQLVLQIEDLALRSVTARLARFLLEQRDNPSLGALIATHLGTTPETVSRALRTLEETGALAFDRHRIVIQNAALLREIALL
jgi:CRP/FNR family transcriptional regulator